jgi:hypothetical protein
MAVNGDVESKAMAREELRQGLITSSTKRRITQLSSLQQRIADDCERFVHELLETRDS